jgi:glycosyltransferase involved in cell wall biosynthesis
MADTRLPSRIEMVVPALHTGGMETMAIDLARALNRRGHDVGITCLEDEGELAEAARRDGIPVTLVRCPGGVRMAFPRTLVRWFLTRAPQTVHLHNGVWLKGARAARLAGVPRVIATLHGLLDRTPRHDRWLMRLGIGMADCCAAVSDPLAEFLVRDVGVPARKVCVVTNGIDTGRFRPGTASDGFRRGLGIGDAAPLIGIVARLAPVKNHDLLLRAFAVVRARFPNAALAIVGDGPLRSRLEARARELGIRGAIHFTGDVRDPAPVYRAFDVFVLPSLAEGTSISLLEAMASGACIVATAVGGNAALLADGAAGRLVPSDDPAALAAALVDLLEDRARRCALGRAARARAVTEYSHNRMVDQYEVLYGPAPVESARPRPSTISGAR